MASTNKFFGTDGVRGIANEGHLTPESALRLGQIVADELILRYNDQKDHRPFAIIGKDTRRSGSKPSRNAPRRCENDAPTMPN